MSSNPQMTPERWARVQSVFGEALDMEVGEREGFVRETCADDQSLCSEIIALLERHEKSGAFVDRPVSGSHLMRETVEPRTFQAGDVVSGRFRIERFVGEGGMGEVYAALDTELKVPVALKTLHPQLAASASFAERFRREVQLARQVTHPNVCRVFDAGRDGDVLFFTMELLEGETLAQRLERDGRMVLGDALPVIRQLCEGLAAAHAKGIVHRDFKSANVILAGDRAVITDFGLARLLVPEGEGGRTESTGLAIGTPAYMSPEQIEGGAVGPAADIYALGVVMYEMLAGQRPHVASSPLALAAKKVKEVPRPLRELTDVPPPWDEAILKCLAVKPEDRFAGAPEVIEAIEGGRLVRLPARASKRLPWKWAAAAAAVMLVAGGAWVAGRWSRHTPPAEAARWYSQGVDAMAEGAWVKASRLLERAISLDDRYIAAHARLAEVYAELDQGEKAKDEIIHADSLAPNRSSLPAEEALLLEAAQASVARDFAKAEEVYRAIVERAPEAERGRALLDLGRAAEKGSRPDAAIEAYRKAAETGPQKERALLHVGILTLRKGGAAEAIHLLQEAESLFRLTSNLEGVTETMLARGRIYEATQRLADAEKEMGAARDLAEVTGSAEQKIRSRFDLSRVAVKAGRTDEAEGIANQALELASREQVTNLAVTGLNSLGDVEVSQYRWKEAAVYFQRALSLAEIAKTRRGAAKALYMLGQARLQQSDTDGAIPYLNKAADFFRAEQHVEGLQAVLALQAQMLNALGRYEESKKISAELEKVAAEHHQQQGFSLALTSRAETARFEGEYVTALELHARNTALQGSLDRRADSAYGILHQADLLGQLGLYGEASTKLEEARALLAALGKGGNGPAGYFDEVQARILLSQKRPSEALTFALRALRAARGEAELRTVDAQVLQGLAQAWAGNRAEGRRICADALRAAEATRSPIAISNAKIAVAEAAALDSDPRAAGLAKEAREHSLRFGHRQFALRALLIEAAAKQRQGLRREAGETMGAFDQELKSLEPLWGPGAAEGYRSRPDVRSLVENR